MKYVKKFIRWVFMRMRSSKSNNIDIVDRLERHKAKLKSRRIR